MSTDRTVGHFDPALEEGMVTAIRLWIGKSPRRIWRLWRWRRGFQQARRKRTQLHDREGLVVPPLLIFSPTMRCNLSCAGCYSRDYPQDGEMTLTEIDDLFSQAQDLGIFFFVLTGGEPLLRDGLMGLLEKHRNLIFLLFTNGKATDSTWAKQVAEWGHVVPILSLEGDLDRTEARRGPGVHEQVLTAMSHLRRVNAFFGFSTMVTRRNLHILGEGAFIDDMIEQGCGMGFLVNYVPMGSGMDMDLVPTEEEQTWLHERAQEMQRERRILLVHLPDDEYTVTGSCMAAGRGFLHINAQGYAEPCPFAHLATDTVREKPLKQVLRSPLFAHIRDHSDLLTQPHMGCALFEHRAMLEQAASQLGAQRTDAGTESARQAAD